MVPGSTLIYGSNFKIVTDKPRDSRSEPSDAAIMPLPIEETTPPVIKIYLLGSLFINIESNTKILAL
jgi:hypothetical protein